MRLCGRVRRPLTSAMRDLAEYVLGTMRRRTPILRGRRNGRAQSCRCMPTPAWVIEKCAGQGDHVGLATRDDRFGLQGLGDQADRSDGKAAFASNDFGKGHLV